MFDVNFMLSFIVAVDQDVIEIHSTEIVEIFAKSVVDIVLERGRPIT